MTTSLRCFTAYDVRGKIPDDFDEHIALRIALAFTEHCKVKKLVIGRDMRLTSPLLAETITAGLLKQGIDIVDIGLCGTEEVYQAVFGGVEAGIDGGIMITASHNPAAYNGMKIVQQESRPVSSDSGLLEIERLAADDDWFTQKTAQSAAHEGAYISVTNKDTYIKHILSMVDCSVMQPMKIVVNAGNGCAGPVLDLLAPHLPFEFIRLNHEPDGTFPNGVPNPLLP